MATTYQRALGKWSETPARRLLWSAIQAHHRLTETPVHGPAIAAGETRIHRALNGPVGKFSWKSWHAQLVRDHPELLQPKTPETQQVGKDAMTSAGLATGGLLGPDQTGRKRRYTRVPVEKAETQQTQRESGLFVGLWLVPEDAARLAVAGGEAPDSLHVTVIYSLAHLTEAQAETALRTVSRWSQAAPREAAVADLSMFHVSQRAAAQKSVDQDVLIAVVPPASLDKARDDLIERLRAAGIPLDLPHPKFKPHVTLAYIPASPHDPVGQPRLATVHFGEVVVGFGDQTVRGPFGQILVAKYSPDQERDDHGRFSGPGGTDFWHPAQQSGAAKRMEAFLAKKYGTLTGPDAVHNAHVAAWIGPSGVLLKGDSTDQHQTSAGKALASVGLDPYGHAKGSVHYEPATPRSIEEYDFAPSSAVYHGLVRVAAVGDELAFEVPHTMTHEQFGTIARIAEAYPSAPFYWDVTTETGHRGGDGRAGVGLDSLEAETIRKAEWVRKDEGDEYEPGDLEPDVLAQIDVLAQKLAAATGTPVADEVTKLRNDAVANVAAVRKLELPQSSIDAAVARNFENVAGITDTTRDQLRDLLRDTLQAGRDYVPGQGLPSGGPKDFAQRLRAAWDQLSRARANLIANTEYNTTASSATLDAYRQQDMAGKIWITAGDDLVCPVCEDNAAVGEIGIDELFPSDDDAPPAHPGCRCAVAGSTIAPDQQDQGGEDVTASVEGIRKGNRFRRRDLAHERHGLGDHALMDQMITYKDEEPVAKYNDDEARDDRGRWTSGGGSADPSAARRDQLATEQGKWWLLSPAKFLDAHPDYRDWQPVELRAALSEVASFMDEGAQSHALPVKQIVASEELPTDPTVVVPPALRDVRAFEYSPSQHTQPAFTTHLPTTENGRMAVPLIGIRDNARDKGWVALHELGHIAMARAGLAGRGASPQGPHQISGADEEAAANRFAERLLNRTFLGARGVDLGKTTWYGGRTLEVTPYIENMTTLALRSAGEMTKAEDQLFEFYPCEFGMVMRPVGAAIAKYDENETRDDHGRWTADDAANDIEGNPFVDKKGVSHDFTYQQVVSPSGGLVQHMLTARPSDPHVVPYGRMKMTRLDEPPGATGGLAWYGNKIDSVAVHPDFRRSGLATEMLARARTITPGLTHDPKNLSSDGRAWSAIAKSWMDSVEAEDNRLAVSDEIAKQMDLFGD